MTITLHNVAQDARGMRVAGGVCVGDGKWHRLFCSNCHKRDVYRFDG